MSKEKSESMDSPETAPVHVAGNRRAAKSRSGKPAKSAKAAESASEELPIEEQSPHASAVVDLAGAGASSESPEAWEASPQEKNKRKRRRKKGKGGVSNNATPQAPADANVEVVEKDPAPRQPAQPSRRKPDSEGVAKLAWKIFLAEVSEEGVALIGDNDAKELSRRCFRLAEIFMEEQARRG
jgi:hypothetical protein